MIVETILGLFIPSAIGWALSVEGRLGVITQLDKKVDLLLEHAIGPKPPDPYRRSPR